MRDVTAALVWRGMLAGVVAGLLCFGFFRVAGEPSLERAIAVEHRLDDAKAHPQAQAPSAAGVGAPHSDADPRLVSRGTQAGIGLLTGVLVYNIAFGGLFGLTFALAYRRIGELSPRATAAVLAMLGLIAVALVPGLKYPATPPGAGDAATIGLRTSLYFAMISLSLAAIVAASMLRACLVARYGGWAASLVAAAAYLVAVGLAALALPAVDEVPEGFPAELLWQFRLTALGAQLIIWACLGLVFGALAERLLTLRSPDGAYARAGAARRRWVLR